MAERRARRWRSGRCARAFTVILPAAAPTILTGMRISIGIAWLVIVAAEMLVGGTGIGYFVWNEWNNLSITNVIIAILVIGLVGMLLDQVLAARHAARHLSGVSTMNRALSSRVEGIARRYPRRRRRTHHRLRGSLVRRRQGRVRLHHRPFRLRQDHRAQHPGRARRAERGRRHRRRPGDRRARASTAR